MSDQLDDLAREQLEDRAVDMTPHDELPAWPLRAHLELLADALSTPSENPNEGGNK